MAPSHSRPHGRRVPSIIVHGGAGAALENAETYRPGIRAAVAAGWAVLVAGGRALDAVEAAVRSLENDERFNAGRGSVLTEAGTARWRRRGRRVARSASGRGAWATAR